jgi:signal peptidase I
LSILWPGLGHIFIKKVKRSIFFIVFALSIQIIFWQFLCFNYYLFIINYICFGFAQIFAIIDSIKFYRNNKISHKIIVGIIFIIISFLIIRFVYLDNLTKLYRYRPSIVSSSVMANTLFVEDIIVCDLSKNYKNNIKTGDVIIYRFRDMLLVSRCIALEDDRIRIQDDNVYINDILLNEPYKNLDQEQLESVNRYNLDKLYYDLPETIIEKNKIFLLGDNRYNSNDSRFIGQLPREVIAGKALYIYSSRTIDRIGKIIE